MLIASFDVGVKNLAFCVMRYDADAPSGRQFPIIEWNCFDLTESIDGFSSKICSAFKGNGQPCALGAKIITDEGVCYCGTHNPDKERYKPVAAKKVAGMTYEKMGNALMDRLDALKHIWDQVDHVIIEQQFNKNRKMIFLSAIIFAYFMQSGQRKEDSKIKHVKFASSRNKLLVYDGPAILERTRKGDKDHRKWIAVKHCEWLVREDKEHLDFLHRYPKKKDDLSDCFLQGADYLKNDCRAVRRPKSGVAKKAPKKVPTKKRATKKLNKEEPSA